MPGDQLLEVNGRLVNEMTRDEIIQEIEQSGSQILVRVRAMPELAEFCCQQSDDSVNGGKNEKFNNILQFDGINSNNTFSEVIFIF